jgi:hypothetical protein
MTSGISARPVARAVIMIGDSRSIAPRSASSGRSLALVALEMLIVVDQHDLVARAIPNTVKKADQRSERDRLAGEVRASTPPTSADGSVRTETRQAQRCRTTRQDEKHDRSPADREVISTPLRRLPLGVLAEDSAWYRSGTRLASSLVDFGHHRREILRRRRWRSTSMRRESSRGR